MVYQRDLPLQAGEEAARVDELRGFRHVEGVGCAHVSDVAFEGGTFVTVEEADVVLRLPEGGGEGVGRGGWGGESWDCLGRGGRAG